ncbi:Myc-type, basic helix-loop-helix domain-containing protein [Tanacetum coccineum]
MLTSTKQIACSLATGHAQVEEVSSVKALKQDASNEERSLSAQTLAARASRRKISEKTQELGKLIPDGQKMNTAEMFQAAFKYDLSVDVFEIGKILLLITNGKHGGDATWEDGSLDLERF